MRKNIYQVVLALLVCCCIIQSYAQHKSCVITAHRAGAAYAPENSLKAIEMALSSDAQRIELDVRMTKDSVLVLMHDKKINRTTNGKGRLRKMTFDELKTYYLETDSGITGEKVPTLEQAFKLIKNNKTLVLELKKYRTNAPGTEKQLAEFINAHNAYDMCVVHSFCDKVLTRLHGLDSNIRLSKLLVWKPRYLPLIVDTRVRFKSLKSYNFVEDFSINRHFASKYIIRKIHRLDKKVNVWTVNTGRKLEKLLQKGADGIITDKLIY